MLAIHHLGFAAPPHLTRMNSTFKSKSKFLSLVLRHKPSAANVSLNENGWCQIDRLLDGAQSAGVNITPEELFEIVATNEKQRFQLNEDNTQIRANQGHSVSVDLDLRPTPPPARLFHGTTIRFQETIMREGVKKMNRHHVHLSADRETAQKVGIRHGKVLILEVDAQRMHEEGHLFYRTENNVWLVDSVPPSYLTPTPPD